MGTNYAQLFRANFPSSCNGRKGILTIENKWRIDDEWWRAEPVSRLYYAVIIASGQRMVIYKDLANNCWYRQK